MMEEMMEVGMMEEMVNVEAKEMMKEVKVMKLKTVDVVVVAMEKERLTKRMKDRGTEENKRSLS